jgi:hypothetical protein
VDLAVVIPTSTAEFQVSCESSVCTTALHVILQGFSWPEVGNIHRRTKIREQQQTVYDFTSPVSELDATKNNFFQRNFHKAKRSYEKSSTIRFPPRGHESFL